MSGKKAKDGVGTIPDAVRVNRPSSSEVIKDAKRWCAMQAIQTKRPITPRDARTLYGAAPRRESRPPSSYSIGMQSFDPADDSSRPSSVTTALKSKLAPLPRTPSIPKNGEPVILTTKRNRRYSPSVASDASDASTGPVLARENSDLMRPRAVQDRSSDGGKGEETPDEAYYWNKSVLPLLEHLEGYLGEQITEEQIKKMIGTSQSLFHALDNGLCFKQMPSRRRTTLLSIVFRLLNVQSRELHILCAKIILEMRIRNKNLTNVCKLLFTICREGKYDELFLQHKLLSSMLAAFQNSNDVLTKYEKYEAFVYLTGSLKCLTDNENVASELITLNYIHDLTYFMHSCLNALTELASEKKPRKYAESLMVQVCSAYCNMLNVDHNMQLTVKSLPTLMLVLETFMDDCEIVSIVSRIFSKMTMFTHTYPAFFLEKHWARLLLSALSKHYKHPDACIHLTLVVGDLISNDNEARNEIYLSKNFSRGSEWKCMDLLVKIIEDFVEMDVQESSDPHNVTAEQISDALLKIIRIIAHLSISEAIGPKIASNRNCVEILLDLLEKYSINDHEELFINVLAAFNNLSYYACDDNLVLQNRLKLAVLLSDLILVDKLNCVSEVIRVFGNLTKFPDVRDLLHQHKVSDMMVALLDSGERLLVYNASGVLVNMSADRSKRAEIIAEGCTDKLLEVIRDFAPTEWRIGGVACQLLWNLSSDPSFSLRDDLVQLLEDFLTYENVDAEIKKIAGDKETLNYLRITWKEEFYEFAHPLLQKLKAGHYNLIPLDYPIDSDASSAE